MLDVNIVNYIPSELFYNNIFKLLKCIRKNIMNILYDKIIIFVKFYLKMIYYLYILMNVMSVVYYTLQCIVYTVYIVFLIMVYIYYL